jgi:nitroimidazol reductase NimA-like FMN-containing flavoprotein (pyridoxamine 5'-phosphate oxidase superfamily)
MVLYPFTRGASTMVRKEKTVSHFTPAEIEYIKSQRLGRLATVNQAGEPHVVPVTFRYNAEMDTIDSGGRSIGSSKKFRDIAQNANVAFVVDKESSESKAGAEKLVRERRISYEFQKR